MRLTSLALLSTGLVLALVACRDEGKGDDTTTPDAPTGGVRIQDIQSDSMPVGTAVEVHGVVITAIDVYGARTGDMWVQDPAGGAFSGVKVFGVPIATLGELAPGDVVSITNAQKEEFACTMQICGADFDPGQSITELEGANGGPPTVTKTGTGTATATTVDALAIEMLATPAEREAEWEKWEGVLITATKLKQLSDVTGFGSSGAVDAKKFDATGGIEVQSLLADLGTNAIVGTCYQGVTGIGDYFFSYKLLPRMTSDLVGGGTDCAAQSVVTISEIQSGSATGLVVVEDVFITAVSFNKRNLWVSQSLTAAPNEGVYVYRGNAAELDAGFVPGAKVDVLGTVSEYNDDMMGGTLTELTGPTVTLQPDAPGMLVAVSNRTAAELLDMATAPTFESVLVTLQDVQITALGNATNGYMAGASQSGTSFLMSTDALRLMATDLQCYASITGLWTNLQAPSGGATMKPNAFGFIPVVLGSIGTGCN